MENFRKALQEKQVSHFKWDKGYTDNNLNLKMVINLEILNSFDLWQIVIEGKEKKKISQQVAN